MVRLPLRRLFLSWQCNFVDAGTEEVLMQTPKLQDFIPTFCTAQYGCCCSIKYALQAVLLQMITARIFYALQY